MKCDQQSSAGSNTPKSGQNQAALLSLQDFAGHPVRIHGTPDQPLFVAADICRILEISNSSDAISSLDEDEKGVATADTLGGKQTVRCVTESGLYALIFKSRKPEAKAFRKWVTSEVLPAIRQSGSYGIGQPQTFAESLRLLADTVEAKERLALQNAEQAEEIQRMKPKETFFDIAMTSDTTLLVRDAAKLLADGIEGGMGEHRLYRWLRSNGWIYVDKTGENRPYQDKQDAGYMTVTERPIPTNHGTIIKVTPRITQKGLVALHRAITKEETK